MPEHKSKVTCDSHIPNTETSEGGRDGDYNRNCCQGGSDRDWFQDEYFRVVRGPNSMNNTETEIYIVLNLKL
mgnify:CR=1 FL=1